MQTNKQTLPLLPLAKNKVKISSDTGEVVIDYKDYLSVIFGILTHYLRFDDTQAEKLIVESGIYYDFTEDDYWYLISHETPYHWAMTLAYGQEYHNHGYNLDEPTDYEQWETSFCQQHKLNPCFFVEVEK